LDLGLEAAWESQLCPGQEKSLLCSLSYWYLFLTLQKAGWLLHCEYQKWLELFVLQVPWL